MKKLIFIITFIFFNYISFAQDEKIELSDYEKYKAQKEIEDHPSLYNQTDTVYLTDTVYVEIKPEDPIIVNYYVNDYLYNGYNGYNSYYRYYSYWDPWYYNSYYGHYSYWNPYYHNPWYYSSYYPYSGINYYSWNSNNYYNDYRNRRYIQNYRNREYRYGPRESRSGYTTYNTRNINPKSDRNNSMENAGSRSRTSVITTTNGKNNIATTTKRPVRRANANYTNQATSRSSSKYRDANRRSYTTPSYNKSRTPYTRSGSSNYRSTTNPSKNTYSSSPNRGSSRSVAPTRSSSTYRSSPNRGSSRSVAPTRSSSTYRSSPSISRSSSPARSSPARSSSSGGRRR